MKTTEKRELALRLFISSQLSKEEISKHVGCTPKTLRDWIRKGEWEQIRHSQTITKGQLLKECYVELDQIKKMLRDLPASSIKERKILSDSRGVVLKEIELHSYTPLHLYIQVVGELMSWVAANRPGELQPITKTIHDFIEEVNIRNNDGK